MLQIQYPARGSITEFVLVIAAYLLFVNVFGDWRRQLQRRLLADLRAILSKRLGVKNLAAIPVNALENGPGKKFFVLALPCTTAVTVAMTSLFDGDVKAFAIICFVIPTYVLVILNCPVWIIRIMIRSFFVSHIYALYQARDELNYPMLLRAVVVRSFSMITVFERIDENFAQSLVLVWVFSFYHGSMSSAAAYLPLKTFVLFVLPVQLSGIREWLFCKVNFFFNALSVAMRRRFVVAVLIPLAAIVFGIGSVNEGNSSRSNLMFFRAMGITHLVWFAVCLLFPHLVGQIFNLQASTDSKTSPTKSMVDFVFVLTCAAGMIASQHPIRTGFTLVPFGLLRRILKYKYWRWMVLAFHSLAVAHALFMLEGPKTKPVLIGLVTIRIMFALEDRPFSAVQRENALFAGLLALAVHDVDLISLLTFLLLSTNLTCIIVAASREHSAWIVKRELESQAFLSHAIKQKFSGVGNAVEHVLDTLPNSGVQIQALLSIVAKECRQGQNACHAVSFAKNIRSAQYVAHVSFQDLAETLNSWIGSGNILVHSVEIVPDSRLNGVELELDWELLRITLSLWSRGSRVLRVCYRDCGDNVMETEFRSIGRLDDEKEQLLTHTSRISTRLTALLLRDEMNLAKRDGELVLVTKSRYRTKTLNMEALCHQRTGIQASQTTIVHACSLPPNVRVAILDDNLLVRRNVERMIRSVIRPQKSSGEGLFTRGCTRQECLEFAQEIVDRNVDLAIVDENLDFADDVSPLKGTEIARLARYKGFKGCLISHSAGKQVLDPSFDGFVEKSVSKSEFLQGITHVWSTYSGACGAASM